MKKDCIWQAAKAHANHVHNQDHANPVADEAVPELEPHWTYEPGDPGIRRLNHMITCLLEGIQKNTHIFANYKVREITQGVDKNPALFLACLTEAVQKYTNLDITTPAGLLYLHVQFISQSIPDIRRKLQQLEKDPKTTPCPARDLLEVAFKVFNNREEEAKREKDRKRKAKYAFLVAAIRDEIQPCPSHPRPGLRLCSPPPDPTSDATSRDTRQRHARTHSPPQKRTQPVASGDTRRWIVPRDTLVPLGRSLAPRL